METGFSARLFVTEDSDFSQALVRAYNDWHSDEWCGAHPGRFIPMALPVIWDAELCAQEIRRVAEKGCHALTFPGNPVPLGYPSFHTECWDPVWRALTDCGGFEAGVVPDRRTTGPPVHRPGLSLLWHRADQAWRGGHTTASGRGHGIPCSRSMSELKR